MLVYLAVALISAATLLMELALLRLFAVQQFYHFAFMAISLALLGAGASGSLLSLRRRPYASGPLCIGFALATVGAYLVINYVPFDSFSIAWDRRQVLFLAAYFLAAAAPFVFAGLVVGGELMRAGAGDYSHRVYAANLIGSAAGSLGSLPALALLGGVRTMMLGAFAGALAGLFFGLSSRRRWSAGANLFVLLGVFLLIALYPPFLRQQLSPYKTLSTLAQSLDARHVLTEWSATARVDVVESPTIHMMPGLSLLAPVALPEQAGVLLDGDNLMPISALAPESEAAKQLADHVPLGLAYRLKPGAETLILQAGSGLDVLLALGAGASGVTAVEDNGLVIETVRDFYDEATGRLYGHPRVEVVESAGRVFVRRPGAERFELVVVSLSDPHRPVTSGAYTLTEDYTYTIGAFDDYLDVLEEDGFLFVSRWLQWPPSESVRTFATMAEALRERGLEPAEHLLAFRTLRTVTIIASPQPLRPETIETLRDFLRQRSFDAIYFPGVQADELNRFNVLQEPAYHELFVAALETPEALYESYRFDIRPPTDNRPFFFHYFKWAQTPEILQTLGRSWQPFGGSGYFVLVALLVLVSLASAALIIGPLVVGRVRRTREPVAGTEEAAANVALGAGRVFLYFAGLGLGFLFVEIPLAQRFILVLGEPVIALSIIIFTVLLFSGIGSLTVRKWRLGPALALLVLLVLVYPLLLEPFSALALRLPTLARVGASIAVIAPLGYLMGLPFAAGLRVVERQVPELVPWAWAINGSFSVISSVLAVMVALSWGFSAVLWLGAGAYMVALFALGRYQARA